jgi:hypothetical protein
MEHRRLTTDTNTTWYNTTGDRITALNTATQKPWPEAMAFGFLKVRPEPEAMGSQVVGLACGLKAMAWLASGLQAKLAKH